MLEKQIYELETKYLENTKDFGNIFSGFENYLSCERVKVKNKIGNEDRYFSLSSASSLASKREIIKKVPLIITSSLTLLIT